jgi:hypothetical protein
MKNNRVNQQGSAHVLIVIILVVALLGALGVVFYQNFIAKPMGTIVQDNQAETPGMETARFAFDNAIYALDYPDGWSENIDGTLATQSDMALLSPDQTVQVKVSVSSGGIGGTCDANDGLKVRYYNVHEKPNTLLTGASIYLVEAMSDLKEGGYEYVIGLAPEGAETHAAEGDSHCTTQYVGVASRVALDAAGKVTQPTVTAHITFPKLPDAKEAKIKSMDVVKDLMKTDNYKAAVKILESARKE